MMPEGSETRPTFAQGVACVMCGAGSVLVETIPSKEHLLATCIVCGYRFSIEPPAPEPEWRQQRTGEANGA